MPTVMKTLAKNIVKYRKLKQFTQFHLAELIGTSRQTIVRYEHGEGGLDAKTIAEFARVFEVEETDLVTPELPPQQVVIQKAEFDALHGLLANLRENYVVKPKKTEPGTDLDREREQNGARVLDRIGLSLAKEIIALPKDVSRVLGFVIQCWLRMDDEHRRLILNPLRDFAEDYPRPKEVAQKKA